MNSLRILGIDPGSQRTGFGVVDVAGPKLHYVASGVISTRAGEFSVRLQEIFRSVRDLVGQYQPQQIAIERVFVNRNVDSALKLGQARGAAICGLADCEAAVVEYAPRQIKLAVVGSGGAGKEQVQLMVKGLLNLQGQLAADAADALAAAVCHALRGRSVTAVAAVGRSSRGNGRAAWSAALRWQGRAR
ncbi:MAG: crossover junction endodeoxyribonuclease RuvC [Steroidobacteraceae bacterium]